MAKVGDQHLMKTLRFRRTGRDSTKKNIVEHLQHCALSGCPLPVVNITRPAIRLAVFCHPIPVAHVDKAVFHLAVFRLPVKVAFNNLINMPFFDPQAFAIIFRVKSSLFGADVDCALTLTLGYEQLGYEQRRAETAAIDTLSLVIQSGRDTCNTCLVTHNEG